MKKKEVNRKKKNYQKFMRNNLKDSESLFLELCVAQILAFSFFFS